MSNWSLEVYEWDEATQISTFTYEVDGEEFVASRPQPLLIETPSLDEYFAQLRAYLLLPPGETLAGDE